MVGILSGREAFVSGWLIRYWIGVICGLLISLVFIQTHFKKILVLQTLSKKHIWKNQVAWALAFEWPFMILLCFLKRFFGSISLQYFPWVQHYSVSLLQLIEVVGGQPVWPESYSQASFIILRYLALKILCRDNSLELELLSIYPKYIKRLCLKGATGRAGSILSMLN